MKRHWSPGHSLLNVEAVTATLPLWNISVSSPQPRDPNPSCMLAPMSLDSGWLNIVSGGAHFLRNTLPVFKARRWDYIAASWSTQIEPVRQQPLIQNQSVNIFRNPHRSNSSWFFVVVWSRLVVVEICLECRASHTQYSCVRYIFHIVGWAPSASSCWQSADLVTYALPRSLRHLPPTIECIDIALFSPSALSKRRPSPLRRWRPKWLVISNTLSKV